MNKYLILIDPSVSVWAPDATTLTIYQKDHKCGLRRLRRFQAPDGLPLVEQVRWAHGIMRNYPEAELLVEVDGAGVVFRDELLRVMGMPA